MNSKKNTLRNYVHLLTEVSSQFGDREAEPKERIFSISYPAARIVVKKAGELVGISLKLHDLIRHAATCMPRERERRSRL